jgi:sugar/nucleoside kinase (ribokinase family)
MSGAKLRKDPPDTPTGSPRRGSPSPEHQPSPGPRPLRILASGVIFLNHTITVKDFPGQGSNTRAQAVVRLRGGAASACLSVVAQFADTRSWLVAPIGGGSEGAALRVELEREGINTQLCGRRESDGVPKAFVIKSS